MAWPSLLTVVNVHIRIVAADVDQTPATGQVLFHMPYALMDSGDEVIVGRQTLVATLVDGEATIALPATNDPDISPSGWAYRVQVNTTVWQETFYAQVPYDGGDRELIDLYQPAAPTSPESYALLGHNHANYILKSLLEAKGDLLVATAAGTAVRLPVGVNGRVLQADSSAPEGVVWAIVAGGGGGGYKGDWDPATEYQPGELVTYRGGLYGTADGAAVGDEPVVETILYSGTLGSTDAVDGDPYQFRALCQSSKRLRVTGIGYDKVATQTEVPHELRVYDPSVSTTAPLASVTVVGEVAGSTGQRFAAIIGDMLPSRNLAFTLVTGVGVVEAGYKYQTAFPFPVTAGSVTLSAGGYSTSHANITSISSPANYYAAVTPRFEEPSVNWALVGRFDPVWIGSARSYNYPIVPA